MRYLTLLILILVLTLSFSGCGDGMRHVVIETKFGRMELMLYNTTPHHRDNFIRLAREGYYDGLLFHRVMEGFMIQGGDPDSRGAQPGWILGMGGPEYMIDPEIGAPHLRGALAAARDGNPEKRSSGSQFYIVQGRPVTEEQLRQIELQKGIRYNDAQRRIYMEEGGAPFLDGDYTVFGELVKGWEVLDEIAAVPKDGNDRPIEDVVMKVWVK